MAVLTLGADTSDSAGTTVTGGVANTKGNWAEIEDSLASDIDGFIVCAPTASAVEDFLIDIGIGAAAAESVVAANLFFPVRSSYVNASPYFIPLPIAAGTRIAARCQSISGSDTIDVIILGLTSTANIWGGSSITTYGAATADTGGTSIDPGGVANTKGSWVQISSSLTADAEFLLPYFTNQFNGGAADALWLVDIGITSDPGSNIVVANLPIRCAAVIDTIFPHSYHPLPVSLSSGEEIHVRAQCTITDATDRLFDVILLTANATALSSGGGAHFSASL